MRTQIEWEYRNVEWRSDEHQERAIKWDRIGSWTRVVLTFTSGISALSIFAHSTVMAATFAAITAAVSALNAGFNPPEMAKRYYDAARAYGHLKRPLRELLCKVDCWRNAKTCHDAANSGTVKALPIDQDMRGVWELFSKDRDRIEAIDETAVAIGPASRRRSRVRPCPYVSSAT